MAGVDILVHADASGRYPSFILSAGDNPLLLSAQGIYVLAGRVMRDLFTTPGSSVTNPRRGTVLASIAGNLFDKNTIQADVARSVLAVSEDIKRSQVGSSVPDSELLSRIEIVSIDVPTSDSLIVRLLIVSVAGEELLTTVGV